MMYILMMIKFHEGGLFLLKILPFQISRLIKMNLRNNKIMI